MGLSCTSKDDKLTGNNYGHWKLMMRHFFLKKGLWDVVRGQEERPIRSGNNCWTRLQADEFAQVCIDCNINNHKAMSAIFSSLTKEVSPAIQTLDLASDMWTKLADLFKQDSTMRVITLLGQIFSI